MMRTHFNICGLQKKPTFHSGDRAENECEKSHNVINCSVLVFASNLKKKVFIKLDFLKCISPNE